jgi:hypothetical protein
VTKQLTPLEIEQRSQEITRRANRISKAASKQRRYLPVLPLADGEFTSKASASLPATRRDCPTGYCHHVTCRWHLAIEDAEHRAGRPGLASVPRDASGLTLSTPGHIGTERAGMTLRPDWLRVRGLEIQRQVKVHVSRTDEGYTLHEIRNGTLDHWLGYLHDGEPVTAHDTYQIADEPPLLVANARAQGGALVFDRELPEYVISGVSGLLLTRVRPIASCALDLIERHGKLTNEQTGDAIGRHRTLVARVVRSAMDRAIEVAAEMGMTEGDLLRGLRELGAG